MNIALIPARRGSKRIPRKNMIDFCGKPLFMLSVEQAWASKLVDKVYVSTDDREIRHTVGIENTLDRPSELTGDATTLEEVFLYHANELGLTDQDILICLQPTSPLRLRDDIDNAIRLFKLTGCHSMFSCSLEDDLFLWDAELKPVTMNSGLKGNRGYDRRRMFSNYYRENGSFYILRDFHINRDSRYSGQLSYYPMYKWQSFEIDEPEDIEICEYFMRRYILNEDKTI